MNTKNKLIAALMLSGLSMTTASNAQMVSATVGGGAASVVSSASAAILVTVEPDSELLSYTSGILGLPTMAVLISLGYSPMGKETYLQAAEDAAAFIANGGENPTALLATVLDSMKAYATEDVSELDLARILLESAPAN